MKRIAQIVTTLALATFLCGCETVPQIWPSRVSNQGNAAAPVVSGYQHGESAMLCVALGDYGDKTATVRVLSAVTGRVVFERTDFMKSYYTYFFTVPNLSRGSYTANISTEGSIRATCQFNVD